MGKARKALLLSLVMLGSLFAGCSGPGQEAKTAGSPATAVFEQGKPLNAAFSDSRLAGMKGVAENGQMRLFINEETGEIAVLHTESNQLWFSNPPERDQDTLAAGVNKGLLSSQLQLDFYNSFGQINSINTFTDSIAYKQISSETIPDGVRVSYQFGTVQASAEDLPAMLSKERYEELTGKMDKTGKRAVAIAYKEETEKSAYVRNDSALQGLQLERALKAFEAIGYTEEDLQKDAAEFNLEEAGEEPRIFQAAIEYTLDGDSLIARVPVERIYYPAEYPVNSVSLLSFFGAAGQEEKGSILVPDGSGALIHFNNGKTRYSAYQQTVYGTDQTMDTADVVSREEAVRLPVFGILKEQKAFLGIIEEGAPVATINADVAGRLNSYNYAYPSFYVVNKGSVTLDANGQQRSLPRFQENPMKSDFQVRYVFLSGENATYQGMAQYYQQYLLGKDGLPQPAAEAEDLPFYLQLDGSITKKKHVIGIPYNALEPLTTFGQAQMILDKVQAQGIHNIKLKYTGWFNGGMNHGIPDRIHVDGAVGGKKGLKELAQYTGRQGISLFPDMSILTALSDDGFSVTKDAARTLRDIPATLYPVNPVINRRDRNRTPAYVVAPRLVGGVVEQMLEGFGKLNTGGISLRDLADRLNSDYRKHEQMDRTESQEISVKALAGIAGKGLEVMASGGNDYALPYVTDLTEAPLSSSGFKIEDESIPFYPMVVHGHISYTGKPYNLSTYTNPKQYILKCLEYGSGVFFEWIAEPNYKVKDTEYTDLYAVNYELWMNEAAEIYGEVNSVLRNVQGQSIASHEKLGEGVFKTVYGNGVYVIVNYNGTQVTAEGKVIEAESYTTGGGHT